MEKAGQADEDGEWTFGQVLSLTTWVPIGIELISVYICKSFRLLSVYPFTLRQAVDATETTRLTIVRTIQTVPRRTCRGVYPNASR